MNKETSIYLDAVRFLAACAVFLTHVTGQRLTGGFLWQLGDFGIQAVTVFFVLSGFVIGYATDKRETDAASYVIARAARIFSVALPALLLTFALDAIGRATHPELYSASWGYQWDGRPWQFISNLLFVSQIWFLYVVPGSDLPYWSLGYEIWYYIVFGLAMFAPRPWRGIAVAATLLIMGPKVLLGLPLWVLGYGLYRFSKHGPVPPRLGTALFVGSVVLYVGYEVWARLHGRPWNVLPDGWARPSVIEDYVVGALFAAHLIGFQSISHRFTRVLTRFAGPIRWMAGATFTMYLFHMPIAQFLATVTPWPVTTWQTRVLMFFGTPIIVFAIAELTERRKAIWQRGFAFLLRRATAHPAITVPVKGGT